MGKGKNFNEIQANSYDDPLNIKYEVVETRYPVIDFTKIQSRFELTNNLWAPTLYEKEKKIIAERKKGYDKINNDEVEKEYHFFCRMQKQYGNKPPKPKLNVPSVTDPNKQPIGRGSLRE